MESNPFQDSIKQFILSCGEDPESASLRDTPERFFKGIRELSSGYSQKFETINKVFPNEYKYNNIIISKDIEFFSLCSHHLLPFYGYAHIGYIPGNDIYGYSKLAKAVDIYSKRLQEQEKLGGEIADVLLKSADAKGVVVLLEAKHFCSCGRGVRKSSASMTTLHQLGVMKENEHLSLFMKLIENRKKNF